MLKFRIDRRISNVHRESTSINMHKALQGPEQLSQVLIGMKITHTLKDKRTNTMLPTLTMACFDLSLFRPE